MQYGTVCHPISALFFNPLAAERMFPLVPCWLGVHFWLWHIVTEMFFKINLYSKSPTHQLVTERFFWATKHFYNLFSRSTTKCDYDVLHPSTISNDSWSLHPNMLGLFCHKLQYEYIIPYTSHSPKRNSTCPFFLQMPGTHVREKLAFLPLFVEQFVKNNSNQWPWIYCNLYCYRLTYSTTATSDETGPITMSQNRSP